MRIYSQHIILEFGIEKYAILIMRREKEPPPQKNDRKSKTAKSRKNQNTQRKRKLQVLENIKSGWHQSIGDEIKKKRISQLSEKASWNQSLQLESRREDKYLGCSSFKIFRTILKMDKGRTSTNGPKEKKLMTMHKTLHSRDVIDKLFYGISTIVGYSMPNPFFYV